MSESSQLQMSKGLSPFVWLGRVIRKVRRKQRVELSLKVDNVECSQTLCVPKDESSVFVQHPTCLQLQALVKATVTPDENSDDDRTWQVHRLELLECPPDPLAVKAILQVPELWKTLEPYNDHELEETEYDDHSALLEDYASANHAMTRRIILRLERKEWSTPRVRPPHINFKLKQELEELERQVDLVDVHFSELGCRSSSSSEQMETMESVGWNLPQTEDNRVLVSGHHKLTRQEYLESKKHPQVEWFLQRLRFFPGQPLRHVVDVGGGRGDLAIALAIGLGSNTRVTVVDRNESSLEAGRRFADHCGVGDRIDWICEDFESYASKNERSNNDDPSSPADRKVDMVVALHACGNLSDMAMDYAVRQGASFLICPCCYSKMAHQDAASRLAEISERPDLSRRGMHVINSKRYWDLMARDSYQVLLEEYSRAWSSRNMVLAGWPKLIRHP